MDITIRRAANSQDEIARIAELLDQICAVHHNARPDLFREGARKYTDAEITDIIECADTPVFVAQDDCGEILGYAFCKFEVRCDDNIFYDMKTLYLDDLCVDEKYRGRGIGRQLLEYVVKFARESGCYNLTLNVWRGNDGAEQFYKRCGMQPMKTYLEMIL